MKRNRLAAIAGILLLALLLPVVGCASSEGNNPFPYITLWGDKGGDLPSLNVNGSGSVNAPVLPPSLSDPDVPAVTENAFITAGEVPVSTFSADVDTASYAYFRSLVNSGYPLEVLQNQFADAFRIEEFLNYFRYSSTPPAADALFGVHSSLTPCPWNAETVLLRMTLQAQKSAPAMRNNLVFLIDISGSMYSEQKLPLLKEAFAYLVDALDADDVISIVTYAAEERVVLDGCDGAKKETILQAVRSVEASGSTNGEAGLQMAYQLAEKHFIPDGNNRIIMASDGDLNVGISSPEELKEYVSEKRESGVYLSVLGFGAGNYRDATMEAIADCGNGIYYYIDDTYEAEKVFGTDLFSTLYTVAEDVKLQITFDPAYVNAYRLIGYENRILNEEDFTDDTKDAGEVGANHQVTVCYELKLTEGAMTADAEWLRLAVNYKHPGSDSAVPPTYYPIGYGAYCEEENAETRFIGCVIKLCMLLRKSAYLPEGYTLDILLSELTEDVLANDAERIHFRSVVEQLQKNQTNTSPTLK